MGHALGLHFSPAFYAAPSHSQQDLISSLQLEKEILSVALEVIELRTLLPTHFAAINDDQFAKLDPAIKKLVENILRCIGAILFEFLNLSHHLCKFCRNNHGQGVFG